VWCAETSTRSIPIVFNQTVGLVVIETRIWGLLFQCSAYSKPLSTGIFELSQGISSISNKVLLSRKKIEPNRDFPIFFFFQIIFFRSNMTVSLQQPTASFLLPSPPKTWDDKAGDVKVHKGISKPLHHHDIQPIGQEFSALARRARLSRSMLEDMELQAALEDLDDVVMDDVEIEDEPAELLARDPKDWKHQDHYQVCSHTPFFSCPTHTLIIGHGTLEQEILGYRHGHQECIQTQSPRASPRQEGACWTGQ
jgi:hypothetical protein